MAATLFHSGQDLSENHQNLCVRHLKSRRFDSYHLLKNPNITIKVQARRGAPEKVGDYYIAGESYDSFDVIMRHDSFSHWIAEDLRSFEDALKVAMAA